MFSLTNVVRGARKTHAKPGGNEVVEISNNWIGSDRAGLSQPGLSRVNWKLNDLYLSPNEGCACSET